MRAIQVLIYSNIFVSITLSALTASSYLLLGIPFNWVVISSVFIGSFVLYSFHRLYKIDFIPINQRGARHVWILHHAKFIKICMTLSVLIGMLLLPAFNVDEIVWLVPAGIASLGYTIPFIPSERRWMRLRDIPLTKPFIIAGVVSYITLCFPIFVNQDISAIFSQTNLTLYIERFVFILAMTIPFEIRDTSQDTMAGLRTLSTELGTPPTQIITLFTLVSWLILWIWRIMPTSSYLSYGSAIIIFILGFWATKTIDESKSESTFVLVFEGLILFYSVGIIVIGLIN